MVNCFTLLFHSFFEVVVHSSNTFVFQRISTLKFILEVVKEKSVNIIL